MEYNPDESVYENVMRNVGKIVKARLSESYKSEKISFFIELSKDYLDHQKKEDYGYQALGIGVSGITKLICIEPNADIYENGVSEFYDVDLISDPQIISSVTDEDCVGYIKNNFQILRKNIFQPQDHKRYFLICYSLDSLIRHDQNTIFLNPNKIQYALEIKSEAIESQLNQYNWHKLISQDIKDEEEDLSEDPQNLNDESGYDVNNAFKSLTHSLPKRTRYKATKIYQKTAQLVDSLNELYLVENNKKLMTRIFIILKESISLNMRH